MGAIATSLAFARIASAQVDSLSDLTQLVVDNVALSSPTTINVGADGRLYVTQQDGLVVVLTVERSFADIGGQLAETWGVNDRQNVDLIQIMPNHDDQGRFQPGVNGRLITGALTDVDENGHVIVYVASSDPRISIETDSNLDTNSGIISRLSQRADAMGDLVLGPDGRPVWEKVDLVRGFPRSEENHAVNGLAKTTTAGGRAVLLLSVGGHTNAGAQSNNFAYTPEYFYAGAIVALDLEALGAISPRSYAPIGVDHPYLFDLPTLDDPTRTNDEDGDRDGDGNSTADVFGGNDGLNQAIFDSTGTVSLYAAGFRNAYGLMVTRNRGVCTVDNGANAGWGSGPLNAAGNPVVDSTGDGLADNGPALNLPNDVGETEHGDQLHCFQNNIALEDYDQIPYAGHPNLFRAHGAAAGFFMFAANGNRWSVPIGRPLTLVGGELTPSEDPLDLAPQILNVDALTGLDAIGRPNVDPRQEVLLAPPREGGLTSSPDGALYTFLSSTNGISQYTTLGDLDGALLMVSFSGVLTAVHRDGLGAVSGVESRLLTSQPLDVVAQGPGEPYAGVVFVAAYGAEQIVVLSPNAGLSVEPDPNDRDLDGLDDSYDPFSVDPSNGRSAVLDANDVLEWSFANGEAPPNRDPEWYDGAGGYYAGGALGFTGIMTNRTGLPETLYDPENIIFGGAPGILQLKAAEPGEPANNTQRNGFQFGLTPGPELESFVAETEIDGYFAQLAALPAVAQISQGLFVGSGDQNNYVAITAAKTADGRVGFELSWQFAFDFIGAVPEQSVFYEVPELADLGDLDTITLGLEVEVGTGEITPVWSYSVLGIPAEGRGFPVVADGEVRRAIQGTLTLPNDTGGRTPVGFATGVLSSLEDAGDTVFALDWNDLTVRGRGPRTTTYRRGDHRYGLNAGGGFFRAPELNAYDADPIQRFTFGRSVDIAGTPTPFLYQSERYGPGRLDFEIPVGSGTYLVELNFAEIFAPAARVGGRVFDVILEGKTVRAGLDVYRETGFESALVLSEVVPVQDDVLSIELVGLQGDPKISAFSVWDAVLVTDEIRPEASISFGPPPATVDDWVEVTVTLSDDVAVDPDSFDPNDVVITGSRGPLTLDVDSVVATSEGVQAVIRVRPTAGWGADTIRVTIPGARGEDAAGNRNPTTEESFTHVPRPPGELVVAVTTTSAPAACFTRKTRSPAPGEPTPP